MKTFQNIAQGDSAPVLIHAHPGHELRLFHWMEQTKPTVLLMTDGAGGSMAPRVEFSRDCIARAGATEGRMFGPMSDRAWYASILRGDPSAFFMIIDAAVEVALAQNASLVVSDAVDGYNPMHDLCEAVGAAAVSRLRRQGRDVTHLVARATATDEGEVAEDRYLDAGALARKLAAIEAYAPLAQEARLLTAADPAAHAVERLRLPEFDWPAHFTPHWEEVGLQRVASNRYAQPITYAQHVRPLAYALLGRVVAHQADREERAACGF
ncbi:MAG: hypothetical protein WAU68_02345 [Vitreimonas sp.]